MDDFFEFPPVSIITVNLNGKDYLSVLLESIAKLDYPQEKLEIIVVDNGSTDGSADFISSNYPQVKLIRNDYNTGFAVANNQGAAAATGDYAAFLNNDTKVDSQWLIELLRPVYGDSETVCAGSKVLSIDGKALDFAGGMINFEGKGFQIDYGVEMSKDTHNQYACLPFVNGGAMLVDRKVFLSAGGFDEDFFAYYEDVDFGWRLWVLGYRVVFAPKSIVYHVHHGTSKMFSDDKLRFLKERNALYSVFKNYDDENLAKVFSGTLSSIYNRIFSDINFDYRNYYDLTFKNKKLQPSPNGADTGENVEKGEGQPQPSLELGSQPLSSLMAVKNFFDELPKLKEKRAAIQGARKRDDKAVFTYFKGNFLSVSPDADYQRKQIDILKSLGIYEIFEKQIKRNLLIISSEVVSAQMAGPAIRVYNFAKVLCEYMNVTLAVPNEPELADQHFAMVRYSDEASLRPLLANSDIVLCGGMTFSKFKSIRESDKFIIMDMYDPYNIATLAEYSDQTIERQFDVYKSVHFITNEMLYYGDFYICASERQRDFWLGMLAALNRVNPYSYNQDPTMRKLIDVVPFGLPSQKPMHTKNVLKGTVPGIDKNDFVIIWGGGIYNWFDPLTLIKAMAKVAGRRSDIKLFFLGIKHPNPQVKELSLVNETVALSDKLGLTGKSVFFNFNWVDYEARQDYFLESDAGIITHPEHIETRFAFRTRILDYLWTALPVISTEGDSLSELVKNEGLGLTVVAKDSDMLADAIIKMAQDNDFYQECKKKVSEISARFTWEKVCAPLISFCMDPVSSAVRKKLRADQIHTQSSVPNIEAAMMQPGGSLTSSSGNRRGTGYLIKRFFYHLFKSGPKKTIQYSANILRN